MLKRPQVVNYAPKIANWINWDEWFEVKRWLFDSTCINLEKALNRINTWKLRGRLPIAIESTAAIVKCRQNPPLLNEQKSLIYSIIIIRMVNGIVDIEQKKVHAQSIANIAERINLPRMLVDIRHDATHNELPSLSLLESAMDLSFNWLREFYWDKQENHLKFIVNDVRDALNTYKVNIRKSDKSQNEQEKIVSDLMTAITNISPASELIRSDIVPLILNPKEKFAMKLPKARVNADREKVNKVFEQCQSLWAPVINSFGRYFRLFYSVFLWSCIKQLIKQSEIDNPSLSIEWECELLLKWIKYLLNSQMPFVTGSDVILINTDDDDNNEKKSNNNLAINIDDLPKLTENILHYTLKYPNQYTADVGIISLNILLKSCGSNKCQCIYHKKESLIIESLNMFKRPKQFQKTIKINTESIIHDDSIVNKLNELCDKWEENQNNEPIRKRRRFDNDNNNNNNKTNNSDNNNNDDSDNSDRNKWLLCDKWKPMPLGTLVTKFHNRIVDITEDFIRGSVKENTSLWKIDNNNHHHHHSNSKVISKNVTNRSHLLYNEQLNNELKPIEFEIY